MSLFADPEIPILPPEAVTADWLTRVLARAGRPGRVAGFRRTRIGTGQVGQSVRFDLDYAEPAPGAPASLVCKFPSPDPVSRSAGLAFGTYEREVRFYREIAPTTSVSRPDALFADVDPSDGDFVLVMTDLAPARPGDQLTPLSLAETEAALGEAAKLHAARWGEDAFDAAPWLYQSSTSTQSVNAELIAALWAGFLERYAGRVSEDHRRVGEAIVPLYAQFVAGRVGPRCLVHNDFRQDNLMFDASGAAPRVIVVDWQTLGYSCCMADVSYFLAGALPPADRRAHERRLIGAYCDRLAGLGVRGYGADAAWRDYVRYSFSLFIMGFTAAMVVERTARGDDMFFAMVEGGARLALDHDAPGLLAAEGR